MHSDFWATEIKEDESGKKIIKIKDLAYNLEAVAEVMGNEIFIRTALSKYTYRIYEVKGECWCEYVGAYRGFLEQKLLPIITPKENLLECEVLDSSILGGKQKTLREYAEDNLKLKKFREQNFGNNGFSKADHPRRRAATVHPVLTGEDVLRMRNISETVHLDDAILEYIVRLVEATRHNERIQVGSSMRGALALTRCARVWAASDNRGYVVPDDVKNLAVPVLAHRITLTAEATFAGNTPEQMIGQILEDVPAPTLGANA